MNRFCFIFGILLWVSLFDGQSAEMFQSRQPKNQPEHERFETLLKLVEQRKKEDYEQAMEYAGEALAIGEKEQDPKMIARAQRALAAINFDSQKFAKSIEYALSCIPFFENTKDVETLAGLYVLLTAAYFDTGNAEMSDEYSDKCIELAEKHHLLEILSKQYYNRGVINFYRGEYSRSMEFVLKALDTFKKINKPGYLPYCYDLLGSLAEKMSEYRKAIDYFNLSRELYLEQGNNYAIGQSYYNMASIYLKINKLDSVRLYYDQALQYYRKSESTDGLTVTYAGLAELFRVEGELDSAQIMIGKGLKVALLSESTKDLVEFYNKAGDIFFQKGDFQKSLEYYHRGLSFALQNRNSESESTVRKNISRNYAALHRFDSAYFYLTHSDLIRDSIFDLGKIQNRAYAFAEHAIKEQLEKEMQAEKQRDHLMFIIVGLCVAVIVILAVFMSIMSARQKKIKFINDELNKYKANLELALQDRTRELVLSEQQIMNLSNNLPNGAIFRFSFENDREGKILYVSSGWEELTGQPINTVKDSLSFFQNRIHPDDSRELLKALAHAIRSRSILDMAYRFYKNNAEQRWFHIRAVANAGDDGLTYLDGSLMDETEQKHFEQELVAAKDKAEESDRLKSAFLANMSHEIRTPMNAVIGFSSLLLKPNLPPQRQASFIELIQANSQKLLRLIDDIVDISKIEADQLNLRMEFFTLSAIMKAVQDHFEPIISVEYPHVELWIDANLLNSLLNIHADFFRLKQIFVNLIENSLKFTEKGFIRCGYLPDQQNFVHFYVMDTGIGIAHENIENIFQSFRKLDQYSDGTGLGLAIVKRMLLQMGGAIWVESEPGVGSTFHFTLPLK